ncbi:Endonuclease-reverse transcriptase [Popillia japonica]|uniref:Endonuclease-reverse transcriptase n=1 Tax=Popillia japonica TaxID=7064 RepID=A0AAW1JJ72_POPJA
MAHTRLQQLHLAAWNACGVKDKKQELELFMSDHGITIMLVGETWLRPGDQLKVPNYYTYRADRLTGRNGGVAVLVKKEVQHVPIYVQGLKFLEAVGIRVPLGDLGGVSVYSVYAPPGGACDWNDLNMIFSDDGPALAAGDFNAKHPSWGCRVTNGRNYLRTPQHKKVTIDAQRVGPEFHRIVEGPKPKKLQMPDTRATAKAKNEPAPQNMDPERPHNSSVASNPTTSNIDTDGIIHFFNRTLGQTSESQASDQSSRTQVEPALEDRLAGLESKLDSIRRYLSQTAHLADEKKEESPKLDSIRRYLSQTAHLADEKKEVPQLAAALRRIISEAPPQTQPLGKFSGQLVEDPAVFLQRLEVHLRNHQLQTPEEIDDAILPHLPGEAATWYGKNQASFLTLAEFQRRFRAEFTGYKRQKALRDATEVQQSPREPVTAFAQRLRHLCLRLKNPDWPEAALVDHIISKMTDRYCLPIAQANPQSMEELYQACEKWESLLERRNATPDPRTSKRPRPQPDQPKGRACWNGEMPRPIHGPASVPDPNQTSPRRGMLRQTSATRNAGFARVTILTVGMLRQTSATRNAGFARVTILTVTVHSDHKNPVTNVPGPSQPPRPRTAGKHRAHEPLSVGSVLAATWRTTAHTGRGNLTCSDPSPTHVRGKDEGPFPASRSGTRGRSPPVGAALNTIETMEPPAIHLWVHECMH